MSTSIHLHSSWQTFFVFLLIPDGHLVDSLQSQIEQEIFNQNFSVLKKARKSFQSLPSLTELLKA